MGRGQNGGESNEQKGSWEERGKRTSLSFSLGELVSIIRGVGSRELRGLRRGGWSGGVLGENREREG